MALKSELLRMLPIETKPGGELGTYAHTFVKSDGRSGLEDMQRQFPQSRLSLRFGETGADIVITGPEDEARRWAEAIANAVDDLYNDPE